MTKALLENLTDKQREYLETVSSLIGRASKNGLKLENERQRGKLRGFLESMCVSGQITGAETRVLYLYFVDHNNK